MEKPKVFKAKVTTKNEVSAKVTKLKLSLIEPNEIVFNAGQFINLDCGNGKYRSYSISSSPYDTHNLTVLVETAHEGLASNYVRNLKIGESVSFVGPSGKLQLHPPLPMTLFFFATGTGVAPFLSMFHELVHTNFTGRIRLHVGFRREADCLELAQLDYFKNMLHDFDYIIYFSQPEGQLEEPLPGSGNPVQKKGYVTQALGDTVSLNSRFYICGHPDMVVSLANNLLSAGVTEDNIVVEEFTRKIKLQSKDPQ